MCDHGDYVNVEVSIPSWLSHTGAERRATKPIDSCLAAMVGRLDEQGFLMAGSCCGHGKTKPEIVVVGRRVT